MRRFLNLKASVVSMAAIAVACGLMPEPLMAQQTQPQPGATPGRATAAQPNTGPATGQAVAAPDPVAPFPPVSADEQVYLDKVLQVWEQKSAAVNRYACTFNRWQYDPSLADNDAYTFAAGSIKYMEPDKGLFEVERLEYFNGRDKDQKPQYRENAQRKFGEYWICDGQFVHILDRNEKKCTKYELPPSMRGNGIHLSPLPFLFGVKANDVKTRYWVHRLNTPAGRTNEVWLEAYPRRAEDAANYQRVQVALDTSDLMPKLLIVLLPNWRAEAQHREVYEFKDRAINEKLLQRLNFFQKEFIPAEPPKDWKVIVEPYQAAPLAPQSSEPRVATPASPTSVR